MTSRLLALILGVSLFGGTWLARPAAQAPPAGPSLFVLVVVDQMRFDYLTRLGGLVKGGLHRLIDEGAVFDEARYPYLNTITCAGHTTIGTGAFPVTHGIALNEWYDRATKKRVPCTLDPNVQPVPYGGAPEANGHSAHLVRIPSFGDRLRERFPASRVVSMSMKPRSAVMMAGHGGTVTWFSDANTWATSTAFTKTPIPEVAAFVQAHPVDNDRNVEWARLFQSPFYTGEDAMTAERPMRGWTNAFPHPLSGAPGTPEKSFYDLWERSPYSDAYLGRMAAALAERFQLGSRATPDMLAVSFSALDYVGHDFGPDSHEAQDAVLRLDRALDDLFTALDTRLGRDRYVVALSADHGVAPIPEERRQSGQDAGRVDLSAVRAAVEKALAPTGPGPHVADILYTDLYLTDATREHVARHPDALKPALDAIAAQPGVMRVLNGAGLEGKRSSADPIERAVALSHAAGRSGDVMIVPKPYWLMTNSSGTTHGTLHDYDQRVPVVFLGAPFKAGHYADAASPADIMPTFASLIGLPLPGTDGKALDVARARVDTGKAR